MTDLCLKMVINPRTSDKTRDFVLFFDIERSCSDWCSMLHVHIGQNVW